MILFSVDTCLWQFSQLWHGRYDFHHDSSGISCVSKDLHNKDHKLDEIKSQNSLVLPFVQRVLCIDKCCY